LLDFPVVQNSAGLLPWLASLWVDEHFKLALWAAGVGRSSTGYRSIRLTSRSGWDCS